jgi:hypothetical protein
MEEAGFSETILHVYRTARHHFQEGEECQECCVNLEYCILTQQITTVTAHCLLELSNALKSSHQDNKSLVRPTFLSIFFSVQGTGSSPAGPDPENGVGYQDIGSPGRPVSSGLQVPGQPFPSWSR